VAEILTRLGKAGKIDLARTVIWLLRSRDVNVRRMAVELVQTVENPDGELWAKLLTFLRDEDWWVRERVMDALADMAGEKLLRHLAGFLQDPSDIIRRFGVDALLRLRSPASLGTLLRTAASDPDWWVRERAIEAVAAIRDPRAVPHLVDILLKNPHLQVACLTSLAELGGDAAAPHVASLLQSDDSDVQLAALRCLRVVGGSAQAPVVQPLLRDPRPEVRALARELIVRWGDASRAERAPGEQPLSVLDQLLVAVAHRQGDDLILAPGRKPLMKRMGITAPIAATVLSAEKVKSLLAPHLSLQQLEGLDGGQEVDFSYRVESEDLRFRVNVFQQLGGVGAVFRIIKASLPELEKLGLPPVVTGLAELQNGLVLVGGATGAGKSTTLAALIDHINRAAPRHIITLEDPIEVVHKWDRGLVNQREVGTHTGSFTAALRSTLRQDPDVVLVGELRDLPTISFAVTAAETGHLVFGTIHTVSAAGTVDRLVNAFPAGQQDHVRSMLAGSLRAVICQHLVPRADGHGRCLAVEVMLNSDAVANLIRKGKAFQIPSVISTSREQGMQLMDVELLRLAREGTISVDEAYARALSKKDFESLISAQDGSPAGGGKA
jgi:twitching motility protein PilT